MPRISRLQAAAERFKNPLQLDQQAADPPLNEPLKPLQRSHRTSQGALRPPHLCLPHNRLLHKEVLLNPLSQNWTSHPQTLSPALKSSKDATPKKHGTHSTIHGHQVYHDASPFLPGDLQKHTYMSPSYQKNNLAFTHTTQPLRATASAPVELRSAQQFHPVRPRRQPSLSRHHSFSSPTNLLHWFNLGPLQNCLFYFRKHTFSILGPATCHAP